MSLKGFHIVLISLSSLVGLLFGGWSMRAFVEGGKTLDLVLAIASFAVAAVLVVYIVWFARKVRTRDEEDRERRKVIRPLALMAAAWILSTRAADACIVCYGGAEGPLIEGARMGVFMLFGLVLAVQIAFALFFLCLRSRARRYREAHSPEEL